MAQSSTKRPRPTFSPPRPKKSAFTKAVSKSKDASKQPRARPSLTNGQKKQKSRAGSPTPSASASEAAESDESSPRSSPESERSEQSQSPEPDFILAEVTHEPSSSSSEPPIPLPLLHTIVQHHFQDKEQTKMSKDAREVLGKYVEVFVREAIMRASYESGERTSGDDSGIGRGEGGNGAQGSVWLEVEDLEKVSAQLCLDF